MMKGLTRTIGALAAAVLTIGACGGGTGGNSDDPVGVVNQAMAATESGGFDALTQYACEANKADIADAFGGADLSGLAAAGIDPDELFDAMKIDFDNIAVNEVSRSGDEATVHVKGTMKLTFDDAKIREIFKAILQAQGIEPTDQMIDAALLTMQGQLSQTQDVETDMKVLQENGKWVICE
jgi:hypothetical protein